MHSGEGCAHSAIRKAATSRSNFIIPKVEANVPRSLPTSWCSARSMSSSLISRRRSERRWAPLESFRSSWRLPVPPCSPVLCKVAHPGGNVTGLSGMDAEIGGKRLQLLRELIPDLARVAVLASNPSTDPFSGPFVEDLRLAARRAGLRLEPVLVNGPDNFADAFATMARAQAQAVIIQGLFDSHRVRLLELAAKDRLGLMSGSRDTTAAGGLVSISGNFILLYERAALYVDKIIKGSHPASLPVEQPTKFQVVINMKTARSLGLMISPTLLAQADEVIE